MFISDLNNTKAEDLAQELGNNFNDCTIVREKNGKCYAFAEFDNSSWNGTEWKGWEVNANDEPVAGSDCTIEPVYSDPDKDGDCSILGYYIR